MKRLKNKIIEIFYILMIKTGKTKLKNVPEKFRSTKVCLTAYKKNFFNIEYFPKDNDELFTKEFILKMIHDEIGMGFIERGYIPKKYITKEIALSIIKKKEYCVKYIIEENDAIVRFFEEDILLGFINRTSFGMLDCIIKYIPEKYITPRIAFEILDKHIKRYEYNREVFKEDILLKALIFDPFIIIHFPKDRAELFEEDILLKAVDFDPFIIEYIPEEYITNKIYLTAFNKDPLVIRYFPKDRAELFKEEMIFKAVLKDNTVLCSIPEKYIEDKIYLSVFLKSPLCIESFREGRKELYTEEIILKAIEYDPNNIKYIPEKYINNEKLKKIIRDKSDRN